MLPLTLAILDGMSVKVGNEVFILPLSFVMESLQPAGRGHLHRRRRRRVHARARRVPAAASRCTASSDVEGAQTEPTQGIVGDRAGRRTRASRCWSTNWSASSRWW